MSVTYELTCLFTAGSQTHSVYDVVETALEKAEKILTCDTVLLVGSNVVLLELLLLNTVVAACGLLLTKLHTVFLNGLASGTVLTRYSGASYDGALIGKAAVALKEKLLSFSAAQLAGRSCISCHLGCSSL